LFYWLDSRLEASPTFYLLNNHLAGRSIIRDLLVGKGRVFADHPVTNRLAYQHRVDRFRSQLRQFAIYCREHDITVQWIVPACADSVYEPDRSVVAEGTSDAEIARLKTRYDEALALEASKKWQQAADIYRAELQMQPGFAEFHFRLAECLAELGQFDEARTQYLLARDTDGCPTRANSDFRRQQFEVAEEFSIPHLDGAEILRSQTAHGIIDRSMVHDNVHPTLRAFFLLGVAAADQAQNMGLFDSFLEMPRVAGEARLSDAIKAQELTNADLVNAYHHTADDLRWLGRLRWEDSRRVREADEYDRRADRLKSGEIKPGQEGTESLD
jgi:tetratricopeptide (TPR) repeat protein